MNATTDISEVSDYAIRVLATSVEPGDLVFDPMGRTYPVKHVRVLRDGTTRIIREDGVWSYIEGPWEYGDGTITVVRRSDVR